MELVTTPRRKSFTDRPTIRLKVALKEKVLRCVRLLKPTAIEAPMMKTKNGKTTSARWRPSQGACLSQ